MPNPAKPFEPTLALIERRLAARHQDRTFHPGDPLWVLFTPEEIHEIRLRLAPSAA